jgi:hypothetical protein
MGSQQQTLLEAMEQQCISIAKGKMATFNLVSLAIYISFYLSNFFPVEKGGIVCTLPCKVTLGFILTHL